MNAELDVLKPINRHLQSILGEAVRSVRPKAANSHADAVLRAGNYTFVVEIKASNRLQSVLGACDQVMRHARAEGHGVIPLVAVPFMGPTGREACAKAGVSFVDSVGNAHIEAPGLFVHVEGKRHPPLGPGRPASVFAPRSSRVARTMLLDPGRWWRQRELAEAARLGPGFISRIVGRLREGELLDVDSAGLVRARNPDRLLDAWKDEYDFRAHRLVAGHAPARCGEELADRLARAFEKHQVEYAFTGLPAAAMLAPFAGFRLTATYVRAPAAVDMLGDIEFHGEERGANCWILIPRDEGVFDGARVIENRKCVSAVQTYLDLGFMPERAAEAAVHLRETCLKWR